MRQICFLIAFAMIAGWAIAETQVTQNYQGVPITIAKISKNKTWKPDYWIADFKSSEGNDLVVIHATIHFTETQRKIVVNSEEVQLFDTNGQKYVPPFFSPISGAKTNFKLDLGPGDKNDRPIEFVFDVPQHRQLKELRIGDAVFKLENLEKAQNVPIVATAEESGFSDIHVVGVERASIDEFKDRPLTCIIVEIGNKRADSNFVLGNKNVLGKTRDGTAVPVLVIFVVDGSREVLQDRTKTGPLSLVGWQIGVGNRTFKTFGQGSRPAAVFDTGTDGSIQYTFTKPAKVQMGLVFPKEPSELIEVQILGKALKLPSAERAAPKK